MANEDTTQKDIEAAIRFTNRAAMDYVGSKLVEQIESGELEPAKPIDERTNLPIENEVLNKDGTPSGLQTYNIEVEPLIKAREKEIIKGN